MLTTQHIDPSASGQKPPFFLLRWFRQVREWIAPPTVAHMDRQSVGARRAVAITIVLGCLTMVVLAIVYARPVKDSYDDWSASRMIKEARGYLETDTRDADVLAAVLKAQEAVSIAPEHIEALRLNAELLTVMGRNESIYFWEKLEKLGASTLADQRGKVRALLRLGRDKEASQLLEQLLRDNPADNALIQLSEEVWGRSQSNDPVRRAMSDYVEAHQEDAESRLRLYMLQLRSNVPSEHSSAIKGLWDLGTRSNDAGLNALLMLAEHVTLSPGSLPLADRQKLVASINKHPKAKEEARAKALDLAVAVEPMRRAQIIDEEMRRCYPLSREEVYPFVRWLVLQREFDRVLGFLASRVQEMKSYQPLMLNYLTALSARNRWDEVESIVTDKEVILSIGQRAFYQAHLKAIRGGDLAEVKRLLLIVLQNASGDAELLIHLGEYCEEPARNLLDLAQQAYEACTRIPRKDRPAFPGWIRSARNGGDTAGLLRAATEANRRFPDDQNYLESVLYAKLLLGIEVENSLARALRLLAANPQDSVRKLIVGLGHYRLNNSIDAVKACQEIDLNDVTPGQQAVFAAIALDAGFEPECKRVLIGIKESATMLPEEEQVLAFVKEQTGES